MFNNTWRFGLNAAIISAGGVFAGPVAGPIADRWGRKFAIAFGNMLIILGVILQASASACTSRAGDLHWQSTWLIMPYRRAICRRSFLGRYRHRYYRCDPPHVGCRSGFAQKPASGLRSGHDRRPRRRGHHLLNRVGRLRVGKQLGLARRSSRRGCRSRHWNLASVVRG